MKKLIEWFSKSNRWKHLVGGVCIGACSGSWFTAIYASLLTAGALEYKDKAYGGKWDWVDFGLTIAGTCLGRLMFCWV